MNPLLSLTTGLGLLTLPLSIPAQDTLVLAPAVGTELERRVVFELDVEGEGMSVVMDGREVPSQFLPPIAIALRERRSLEVSDVFGGHADGELSSLTRTYRGLELRNDAVVEVDMEGQETVDVSSEGSCALVDRSVRFARDDSGAWGAAFADDEEGDAKLLEGLAWDLDLHALVAEAQGESWTASADALRPFLLPVAPDQLEWNPARDGELLGVTFEGELTLTRGQLETLEEEGGARLLRVGLEGVVAYRTAVRSDLSSVPVADGAATHSEDLELELEGELVWNLTAKRLSSFEATGSVSGAQRIVKDEGQPGPSYESSIPLTGTVRFALTTAVPE